MCARGIRRTTPMSNDIEARPAISDQAASLILCGMLLVCTAAVYWQAHAFEFVDWDDFNEVTQNPLLHPPTWEHLKEIWAGPYIQIYAPLSYTAWWALSWMSPGAETFHLLNVGLHLVCVGFVFSVLRKCVKSPAAALVGAAIFALHPMQVETVGWVSEMNNLLAAALALGAIRAFLAAGENGVKWGWYAVASVLFVAALFSKPTAVMTPVIALVLDAGVLGPGWKRSLGMVLPWLGGSAVFAWIAHRAQGGVWTPMADRPVVALDCVSFYCQKVLWPVGLTIDYGRTPGRVMAGNQWILDCVVMVALGATLWSVRRIYRGVAVGALVSVVALLPVLGLVPFYFQEFSSVADRFFYLAMLGPALAVASLLGRAPWRAALPMAMGVGVLLAILTTFQLGVWADTPSLAAHALKVDPGSAIGNYIAGEIASLSGNPQKAADYFRRSIQRNPGYPDVHFDLGNVYLMQGENQFAIDEFEEAIKRWQSPSIRAMNNLGVAYAKMGREGEAAEEFGKILEIEPGNAQAKQNLQMILGGVPRQ